MSRRSVIAGLFGAVTGSAVAGPAKAFDFLKRDERYRYAGYGQTLDMARQNQADFVLLYDTNHQNRGMATYPLGKDALDAAKDRGVKHIFLEIPREFQEIMDLRAQGGCSAAEFHQRILDEKFIMMHVVDSAAVSKNDEVLLKLGDDFSLTSDTAGRTKFLDRLSEGLIEAHQRGIRVWGADSIHYNASMQARLDQDNRVADFVAEKAGGDLAVVVYGHSHGARFKDKGIDDELARHGRVMPVELTEASMAFRDSKIGNLNADAGDILRQAADRPPHSLNIDTGEFLSDPSNTNETFKGAPRASRVNKPAPAPKRRVPAVARQPG